MPSPAVLAIEKQLSTVQSILWSAAQRAEALRDQGMADDLHQVREELRRIQNDLLKAPRRL